MNYSKRDIDSFFEGKLSKEEAKHFLDWLDSSEGEETYKSIIEDTWAKELNNPEQNPEKENDHLPILIDSNIGHNTIPYLIKKSSEKKTKLIKLTVGMAASLILVFSVSYIFYINTPSIPEMEILIPEEIIAIEKSTPKGHKKKITLPDGSTVVLNADSKLTYFGNFSQNRTIKLEGEGFFDVVRNEKYPFTVITENIETTALGTSFNIKAYQDNPTIQITLATGTVRVENIADQNLLEIQPGEAVYFSEDKKTLKKADIDLNQELSWKEGVLNFDKVPFHLVIKDLERWYDVDFSIVGEKKIPEFKCSGTFKPNEYLSNVLKVLSYSIDFEYKINGNEVTLKFK